MSRKGYLIIAFAAISLLLVSLSYNRFISQAQIPSGAIGLPAYDSGWLYSDGEYITLNHNLGTTELFVYFVGKDGHGISHLGYGLEDGAWFDLNATHLTAYGRYSMKYIRVRIWIIQEQAPPMSEVTSTEVLMILGFGLAIAYHVYNKVKPRLRKHPMLNKPS